MYQARDYETVNMILRNPTLWNEGMIKKTLQLVRKGNSYADSDFNPHDVQELIKDYLLTLSRAMTREDSIGKDRKNEETLHDVNPLFVSGI